MILKRIKMELPYVGETNCYIIQDEKTKKFGIKLIPFVKGSLSYFNNHTNIELNNNGKVYYIFVNIWNNPWFFPKIGYNIF